MAACLCLYKAGTLEWLKCTHEVVCVVGHKYIDHMLKFCILYEPVWKLWGEGLVFMSVFASFHSSAHSCDAIVNDLVCLKCFHRHTELQLNMIGIKCGPFTNLCPFWEDLLPLVSHLSLPFTLQQHHMSSTNLANQAETHATAGRQQLPAWKLIIFTLSEVL